MKLPRESLKRYREGLTRPRGGLKCPREGLKCHREGLTLIELLCAIAVVGVLTVLIVPGVQKIRSHSEQVGCVSNLRRLVAANYLYAADHGGRFAPASDLYNRQRWHGKRTGTSRPYDARYGFLSPYFNGGEGPEGTPAPPAYNTDNPFATTGSELACRSFLRYALSSASFEKGAGSYGYNGAYIGGSLGNAFTPIHTAELADASRTLMFADSAFSWGNAIQEYPFAEPYREVTPDGSLGMALVPSVHFRHDGKAAVAWADGHVTLEAPARLHDRQHKIGWVGDEANNGVWNAWQ